MSWPSPPVMALIGVIIAVVGGLIGGAAAYRASLQAQATAEATTRLIADSVLGDKDTFCQLTIQNGGPGVGQYISTYQAGPGGSIYDIQVLLREVQENGVPVSGRERHVLGTITSNTWPWPLWKLGQPIGSTPRYFEAQITQRNGTGLQDIVVYPKPEGRVELGFLRLEFNSQPRQPDFKLLHTGSRGVVLTPTEIARIAALRTQRGSQP